MKRTSIVVLFATVMAAGVAALLTSLVLAAGSSTVSFSFTPSVVPKRAFHAGEIHVHLATAVTGDSETDRVRFNFDDDFRFSPGAVPTCKLADIVGQLDLAQAMARCGSAKVGSGTGQATNDTSISSACVLAFNARSLEGGRALLLFTRAQVGPSSTTIDCSNPRSNHNGNVTLLLLGDLRKSAAGSDYGTQIDFNHITSATPIPVTDLDLTLRRTRYVRARCFEDFSRTWQLRTKVRYAHPDSVQTVDSAQRCAVRPAATAG